MEELVVLVDEHNNVLGTAPKATVHTKNTPLHRGFSVFLFNTQKQFLVTRRALDKKTFPGVWTNSYCGHPLPDERVEHAAERRAKDELGIDQITILQTVPYRYTYTDHNGIVENEICPIVIAVTEKTPRANPQEIIEWQWVSWDDFYQDIQMDPEKYSPWSREESLIVTKQLMVHHNLHVV